MNHHDSGNFRTNENMARTFTHSCFGRIVILAVILGIVLFFAKLSVPDKQLMTDEIEDDVRQCILAHDSIKGDWIDDAINNIGFIFTYADSTFDQSTWRTFQKNNTLEYFKHSFFSSMYIHNNLSMKPVRVGIGIFNTVIPTLSYEDLLMNVGPMQKTYRDGIIRSVRYGSDYMGEQPHIKEYHYKDDQTQ